MSGTRACKAPQTAPAAAMHRHERVGKAKRAESHAREPQRQAGRHRQGTAPAAAAWWQARGRLQTVCNRMISRQNKPAAPLRASWQGVTGRICCTLRRVKGTAGAMKGGRPAGPRAAVRGPQATHKSAAARPYHLPPAAARGAVKHTGAPKDPTKHELPYRVTAAAGMPAGAPAGPQRTVTTPDAPYQAPAGAGTCARSRRNHQSAGAYPIG